MPPTLLPRANRSDADADSLGHLGLRVVQCAAKRDSSEGNIGSGHAPSILQSSRKRYLRGFAFFPRSPPAWIHASIASETAFAIGMSALER